MAAEKVVWYLWADSLVLWPGLFEIARNKESAQRYQTNPFRGHYVSGSGEMGTLLRNPSSDSYNTIYPDQSPGAHRSFVYLWFAEHLWSINISKWVCDYGSSSRSSQNDVTTGCAIRVLHKWHLSTDGRSVARSWRKRSGYIRETSASCC